MAWAKTQEKQLRVQNNDALEATRAATTNLLVHKLREANSVEKALAYPGVAFDAEALCNLTDKRAKHLREERLVTWRSAMDSQIAARSFAWAHDALAQRWQKQRAVKQLQVAANSAGAASRTSAWVATSALATMDALSSAANVNMQLSNAYCNVANVWVQQHGGAQFQQALDHAFSVEMLAKETLEHLENSPHSLVIADTALPVSPESNHEDAVPVHSQSRKVEKRQITKHPQSPKVKPHKTIRAPKASDTVHTQPSKQVAKHASKDTIDTVRLGAQKEASPASGTAKKCPNYSLHGGNVCRGSPKVSLEASSKSQLRESAALAVAAQKHAMTHAKKSTTEGKTAAVAAKKASRKAEHFRRIGGDFAKVLKAKNGFAHADQQQLQKAAKANSVAAQSEEEIAKLLKKSEYKATLAAKQSSECAKAQAVSATLHQKALKSFVADSAQMAAVCKAENLAMHACQRSSDALCDLHFEAVKLRKASELSNRAQKDAEELTQAASALKMLAAKAQKQKVASAVTKARVASTTVLQAGDAKSAPESSNPVEIAAPTAMNTDNSGEYSEAGTEAQRASSADDPGGYKEAIADATRAENALSGEGPDDETALMQI